MRENSWKRAEYETWDEAFRGLVPAVRQQSVRVAAYTQVLFLQACEDSFGKNIPGSKEQIRSQYPAGTRVELVQMDDAQAPPVGTLGTVWGVDDTGSIMVHWDNGSGLNVVYGIDICRKVAKEHER